MLPEDVFHACALFWPSAESEYQLSEAVGLLMRAGYISPRRVFSETPNDRSVSHSTASCVRRGYDGRDRRFERWFLTSLTKLVHRNSYTGEHTPGQSPCTACTAKTVERMADSLWYLSVEDVVAIHEDIAAEYRNTPAGVRTRGDIEFVVDHIESGSVGSAPETIHEKASHLLRLLVANHPFVDANKRTALNVAAGFYFLNRYRFAYDAEIRTILKRFGTDKAAVDEANTIEYLRSHTEALDLAGEIDERRGELIRRVAADDRDSNRNVYDALEDE